jgi:hypothetical protein
MPCPECELRKKHGFQVYTVNGEKWGLLAWSKDVAQELIEKVPREPTLVPDWLVRAFLVVNQTTPEHIPHVDTQYPGIVAQHLGFWTLIDGSHRAQRCLNEGKPYYAYVLDLSESETARVVGTVKYPDGESRLVLAAASPEMTAPELAEQLHRALANNPHSNLCVTIEGGSLAALKACLSEEDLRRLELRSTS